MTYTLPALDWLAILLCYFRYGSWKARTPDTFPSIDIITFEQGAADYARALGYSYANDPAFMYTYTHVYYNSCTNFS